MSPNEKFSQLERAYEAALIDVMDATDGAGLKIILMPRPPRLQGQHPIFDAPMPRPDDFKRRIQELAGDGATFTLGYRGEEATARNIALLARAWEAAVRYFDFKKELEK